MQKFSDDFFLLVRFKKIDDDLFTKKLLGWRVGLNSVADRMWPAGRKLPKSDVAIKFRVDKLHCLPFQEAEQIT